MFTDFMGQFEHTIDEKGRMTIPASFRERLTEGAFITQGFAQNLMIFPAEPFERLAEQVINLNLADPNARTLRQMLFSRASRLEFDKAGRILIPQFLRQNIQINGAAVVVGMGTYFEIWPPQEWSKQEAELRNTEANTHRFSPLQLTGL